MFVAEKVKTLCKNIIIDYTHHVRDEVRNGRTEYIATGIDEDIQLYKALFLELLGLALGIKDDEPKVNAVVKEETVTLIKRTVSSRRYRKIMMGYRALIYSTCELIFEKVINEIEEGGNH